MLAHAAHFYKRDKVLMFLAPLLLPLHFHNAASKFGPLWRMSLENGSEQEIKVAQKCIEAVQELLFILLKSGTW